MHSSILPITNSYGRVFKCDQNYNAIAQIVNQTNSKRNSQKEKRSQFASGNWVFDWGTKVAWRLPLVWRWGRSQLMSVWRPVGLRVGTELVAKTMAGLPERDCFFSDWSSGCILQVPWLHHFLYEFTAHTNTWYEYECFQIKEMLPPITNRI